MQITVTLNKNKNESYKKLNYNPFIFLKFFIILYAITIKQPTAKSYVYYILT